MRGGCDGRVARLPADADGGLDRGLCPAYAGGMAAENPSPVRYASLFRNGRNQAVRIPKEFEMGGDQVRISRDGNRLILEPVVQPPKLLAVLAGLAPVDEDFPDVDAELAALDAPEL